MACPDGTFERVAVCRLVAGDTVRVLPGEAFPADGCIVTGQTLADEALLTASPPALRTPGSLVTAGSYNSSRLWRCWCKARGQPPVLVRSWR